MMPEPTRILLVEDDLRLADLTQRYLQQHEFKVFVEHHGNKALSAVSRIRPDLLLLDIMLPGTDGLTLCSQLKKQTPIPILLLTARNSHKDEVVGLEKGADDYLSKPVEPMVLLARIRNLLRRQLTPQKIEENTQCNSVEFGALAIDRTSRSIWHNQQPVNLSSQEYDLLLFMVDNIDRVLSRDDLMQQIRGIEYNGLDRTVDVYISRLRKIFGDDPSAPKKFKTVWGKGYLLAKNAW